MPARPRIGLPLLILPAFLLLVNSLRAQICSTEDTRGTYVVVCSGYLTPPKPPNAPLVPAKILGTASADEGGTFNGNATISWGGMLLTQTVKGTEQLKPDCTGTITYTQTINGEPGGQLDIAFVVSEHGDRIDGLATDPGTVLSCELRRLSIFTSSQSGKLAPEKKKGDRVASRSTANPASLKSMPEAVTSPIDINLSAK